MQDMNLNISVQYRDGPLNKSTVFNAVCDLVLSVDRKELFQNTATYAGYSISISKPVDVEAFAIRVALGNNGGEWATHYTDEQKEHWRNYVIDLMLAMRGGQSWQRL